MIFSILLVVLYSDSFLNNWYHEATQDIPTKLKYLFDYNKLVINVIIIIISWQ